MIIVRGDFQINTTVSVYTAGKSETLRTMPFFVPSSGCMASSGSGEPCTPRIAGHCEGTDPFRMAVECGAYNFQDYRQN